MSEASVHETARDQRHVSSGSHERVRPQDSALEKPTREQADQTDDDRQRKDARRARVFWPLHDACRPGAGINGPSSTHSSLGGEGG